jgi:hypothetical protein
VYFTTSSGLSGSTIFLLEPAGDNAINTVPGNKIQITMETILVLNRIINTSKKLQNWAISNLLLHINNVFKDICQIYLPQT